MVEGAAVRQDCGRDRAESRYSHRAPSKYSGAPSQYARRVGAGLALAGCPGAASIAAANGFSQWLYPGGWRSGGWRFAAHIGDAGRESTGANNPGPIGAQSLPDA